MSDPESEAGSRERAGGGFWTSLPGVLTGIAALITAIVGLISILRDPAPSLSGDAAVESGQVTEPPMASNDAGIPRPAQGVMAERRITMRSEDNADLESGVVGSSPLDVDLYFFCSGTDCILNAMQSLMATTDVADSRDACVAAMKMRQEQAIQTPDLREGALLCIQTTEGHVGRIRVADVPGPGTINLELDYTLWR